MTHLSKCWDTPGGYQYQRCRASGWEHLDKSKIRGAISIAIKIQYAWDFPGGAEIKNPPANAGDMGSSPGPGRSHMPRSN